MRNVVEADEQQPEVPLPERLVQHLAGPLRPPEVEAREHREHHRAEDDVVEVRDDEVGVGHVEVERRRRQDDAGETTEHEGDEEADRPDERRLERDRPAPHRADPVEDLHARRHRDEHRHEREERQQHEPVTYMWCAHTVTERAAIAMVVDQRLVPEDRLAAEDREDLGHDAEERQRDDVHLGVPEEPEQVLPQDDAAVSGS